MPIKKGTEAMDSGASSLSEESSEAHKGGGDLFWLMRQEPRVPVEKALPISGKLL